MKNLYILIILAAAFLLGGCWPEASVAPDYNSSEKAEFLKLNNSSSLSVESFLSVSELIHGEKGGNLKLKDKKGSIEFDAELKIKKNSFSGSRLITLAADKQTTSIDLFPTPFQFDNPVELSLEYEGVDLSGVSADEIDFYYISADGSLVKAEYDDLTVDTVKGKLKVKNAKITHFSRYGFTKQSEE